MMKTIQLTAQLLEIPRKAMYTFFVEWFVLILLREYTSLLADKLSIIVEGSN